METLKILGQLVPVQAVLSNLYVVPASTMTSVSSIVICNQNADLWVVFRIALAMGGAVDNPSQYIYYDLPLDPNDTFIATIGVGMNAGDIVRVQASGSNISFNLFGVEVGTSC
jgi:hypothetical protein